MNNLEKLKAGLRILNACAIDAYLDLVENAQEPNILDSLFCVKTRTDDASTEVSEQEAQKLTDLGWTAWEGEWNLEMEKTRVLSLRL